MHRLSVAAISVSNSAPLIKEVLNEDVRCLDTAHIEHYGGLR